MQQLVSTMLVHTFPLGFHWTVSLLAVLACTSDTLFTTQRKSATSVSPETTGMESAENDRNTSASGNASSTTNKAQVPLNADGTLRGPAEESDQQQYDSSQYYWDKERTSAEQYMTDFGLSVCFRNASSSSELVKCPYPRGYECDCGDGCESYGSCCHDRLPDLTVASLAGCLESGWYAVSKCPAEWRQAHFKDLCEKGRGRYTKDEPVTVLATHTVFRNEFCAACHGVSFFEGWKLQVTCEHFQYLYTADTRDGFMDLVVRNSRVCALKRVPPAGTEPRPCQSWWWWMSFINTCNVTGRWRVEDYDDDVAFNCPLFKSLVLWVQEGPNVFQNLFCAVCNGVHLQVGTCGGMGSAAPGQGNTYPTAPPLSLLLGLQNRDVQVGLDQEQESFACLPGQWLDLKVSRNCSVNASLSSTPRSVRFQYLLV